jgi:hypothetical protein
MKKTILRLLIVSVGCLQQNLCKQIQYVGITVNAAHIRGVVGSTPTTATSLFPSVERSYLHMLRVT